MQKNKLLTDIYIFVDVNIGIMYKKFIIYLKYILLFYDKIDKNDKNVKELEGREDGFKSKSRCAKISKNSG